MAIAVDHMTTKSTEADKPAGKPETTTTKVRRELLRKAKTVSSHRDIDLFDYLDAILTATVDKDYAKIIKTS